MKNLISIIRKPFRVHYRLAVLYTGECEVRNTYGTNRRLLLHMAHKVENICDFWTLYMTGPFFLPEREVDCYMKGDRP